MATSLQAQLLAQANRGVASLDLEVQKRAHSKSLVWEPKEASRQSLQNIYSVCSQAFKDLCTLDLRFSRFADTLFSEQSQDQDRTTMTEAENAKLDEEIESFLRLSSRYLELNTTVKAVEWLVRKFRYVFSYYSIGVAIFR